MRAYDEIAEDLRRATNVTDAQAMRMLAAELDALDTLQAKALSWKALGSAARLTGDYGLALEHYRRALPAYEEVGDRAGVATVTSNIGNVYSDILDHQSALKHYRRALALYQALDDRAGLATVTGNIGNVHNNTGNCAAALEHYRRALAMHEELGDLDAVARVTGNIGNVYLHTSDHPTALEFYLRALTLYEAVGSRAGMASITCNLGSVYTYTGDSPSALEHYNRALTLYQELGNMTLVAVVTGNIGLVHFMTGDYETAFEYSHRALVLHEEVGIPAQGVHVIGNMMEALSRLGRFDEAAALFERYANIMKDDPRVRTQHLSHSARLAESRDDLDAARGYLLEALTISNEAGLRLATADLHEKLRNLAQRRNDFAGYIEHNNEFQRITEEVRGKDATQRMAMLEAERKAEAVERERDKERALLYGALPKSVADRMIRGEKITGDHFEHAAVLFIDVASFTTHTASMNPGDVVLLLEDLFSRMDAICDRHGVVKVKTIGDSYMCFRGDADSSTNASCIMHVALEVMEGAFTWPDGSPLVVRMGAHIGPATAGVIGTQRLQYDVWGDTVNVASRMESHGEPGRIHVSEAFAFALGQGRLSQGQPGQGRPGQSNEFVIPSVSEEPGTWNLTLRGETELKGKGTMTTYWLSRP